MHNKVLLSSLFNNIMNIEKWTSLEKVDQEIYSLVPIDQSSKHVLLFFQSCIESNITVEGSYS